MSLLARQTRAIKAVARVAGMRIARMIIKVFTLLSVYPSKPMSLSSVSIAHKQRAAFMRPDRPARRSFVHKQQLSAQLNAVAFLEKHCIPLREIFPGAESLAQMFSVALVGDFVIGVHLSPAFCDSMKSFWICPSLSCSFSASSPS